jgi:hypothetical protein
MKKSILILAAALCLSGAAMAQATQPTDSTGSQVNQTPNQNQNQTQNQNYKKDMLKVKSNEVPASLKTTLQGTEYKGWETGTIYRNQNSDMYLLEGKDGKTYRFDAQGKKIED